MADCDRELAEQPFVCMASNTRLSSLSKPVMTGIDGLATESKRMSFATKAAKKSLKKYF